MIKKTFLLLISAILIFSCGKDAENLFEKDTKNLLTSGKWTLDNKETSLKETIVFNNNDTYTINVKFIRDICSNEVSGNWVLQNNQILLLINPIESIPALSCRPVPGVDIYKTDSIVWTIKTLTEKELTIEFNGEIRNYFHEKLFPRIVE